MRSLKEACVSAFQAVTVPLIRKRLCKDAKDRLICFSTHVMASILKYRLSPVAAKVMLCMAVYRNKGSFRFSHIKLPDVF